jgi:hypothetical protein
MNTPGFTAETSLFKHGTSYRAIAGGHRDGAPAVIPQLSCWRECFDISSTNHELLGCYRVCSLVKRIFLLDSA